MDNQLAITSGIDFDDDIPPAHAAGKEVKDGTYAPTITVIGPDKRKIAVAASAAAARARSQIMAGKLRGLLEKRVDEFIAANKAPDLMSLKRMTEIASVLSEMEIATFERKKLPTEVAMQEFGKQAVAMIGAAAKGGAEGAGGNWRDKMEQIRKLKTVKPAKAELIELEAKK